MIKKDVMTALAAAQQRYMGHLGMLAFQYANICVKHDPSALLPAVIQFNGNEYKIEQVAKVSLGDPEENPDDEYKLYVYPLEADQLIPIIEAVHKVHPEFKIDILTPEDEKQGDDSQEKQEDEQQPEVEFGSNKDSIVKSLSETEDSEGFETLKYRYVCYTMPPVTRKLRDTYEKIVKDLSKATHGKFDVEKKKLQANVAPKLIGYTKEDDEKVNKMVNNLHDQYLDAEKKVTDEKLKEIEDAYAYYCQKYPEEASTADIVEAGNVETDGVETGGFGDVAKGVGSKLKL